MGGTKTILILGTGIMQVPALEAARDMGLYVYAADANDKAPGRSLAHEFIHVDLRDKDAMASAAKQIARERGLDGVFTAGTDFSTTVAWVAEKLNLPGISYETALNCTDKVRMRAVFLEKGIPSPPFCRAERDDKNGYRLTGDVPAMPVVVKPVDNMGARGIRRIDNNENLPPAIETALRFSRSGSCIIESFIPGPEFSIDSLVYRGKVSLCGFADRHIHFPPCFVEMGHTIPSEIEDTLRDRIMEVFIRAVAALGIDNGAAKGDVKLSPNGPVIGEVAARLSGGYMSGWTFPYSSGVEVTKGAINIALGLPPGNLTPVLSRVSSERAFISIPGVIAAMGGEKAASSVPGVMHVFLARKPGDAVVFPSNNVEKCGNIIACGNSTTDAVSAACKGVRKMLVRLKPGNRETFDFLFGERPIQAPDAFILTRKENIEAYAAMPILPQPPCAGGVDGRTISLYPLPFPEEEEGEDWHGNGLSPAINTILEETGALLLDHTSTPVSGDTVLGKLFWKAVLKGSIQGGIWIIDTVRETGPESLAVQEFAATWND